MANCSGKSIRIKARVLRSETPFQCFMKLYYTSIICEMVIMVVSTSQGCGKD